MNNAKTVFIDCGHGGIDPNTGRYTTAPSKMWKHNRGVFHDGSTFYEGVSNRVFGKLLAEDLTRRGYSYLFVNHPWRDNSLKSRVDIANAYHRTVNEGIYVSLHSNAVNRQDGATGISVWTSVGQTASDPIATSVHKELGKLMMGTMKMMSQVSQDKDPDYESQFYVLVNTIMPAILLENGFFDNFNDSTLLMNKSYQDKFIKGLVDGLIPFLK